MVRIALAGLGFMGKTHLGIYLGMPNAKVEAICDAEPAALDIRSLDAGGNIQTSSGAVDLSGVRKYASLAQMLSDGGYDVVDICLPTYLHAEWSIKALHAGNHVFCEKPLALTAAETVAILAAIRQTGKLFSVGQCLRHWPAYAAVKDIVASGRYGRVKYVEFARFSQTPTWTWKNWILDGAKSGNAALDLHVHDVDTLLYLVGMPKSVRSRGVFAPDGSVEHIATVYQYDGLVAQSTGGWIASKSFGFNMRAFLILERATVELDFSKTPPLVVYPAGGDKFAPELAPGDGYYHELRDFVAGIERGQLSGIVTADSAADSVRVCLAEIQSARENREIGL